MKKYKRLNNDDLSKVVGGVSEGWVDPTISFIDTDRKNIAKSLINWFKKHSRRHKRR